MVESISHAASRIESAMSTSGKDSVERYRTSNKTDS